jgi:crotonobetainyl-CoA:carnitine CoA-transferase CaiB-like acyl-CoA transferase
MSYEAPFAGLKVVDLSQGIAGPYCGMLLAQYGADVIKVEPLAGDWSRTLSRRFGDQTAFSIGGNLGKRSIAVDLKAPDGAGIVHKLAAEADVFIEGFRPGVIARLGFGYEALKRVNRRLLYLSISGFGQSGPLAGRPALDPVLQAFTGMMVDTRLADGTPHRVGGMVIDMTTGLYAFQAVSAALYARRDEAEGRYIETSLMQTGAALQAVSMLRQYLEDWRAPPGRAPNGIYPTRDGWIMLIILGEKEFPPFCAALDRPELAGDPRFHDNKARLANAEALNAILRTTLAERDTAEWSKRLTKANTLHEAVNDFATYLEHPHVTATGMVSWLRHPQMPQPVPIPALAGIAAFPSGEPRGTAPALGEHTTQILMALGYGEAAIADMERHRVIGRMGGSL